MIENSKSVPFIEKKLVDIEEFFEITNNLRSSLPREMQEVEIMLQKAKQIKQEAEAEAKNIIAKSQSYATNLVQESEITKQANLEAENIIKSAQQQAEEIIKEAEDKADNMTNSAEEYAKDLLQNIIVRLKTSSLEIEKGLEEINSKNKS